MSKIHEASKNGELVVVKELLNNNIAIVNELDEEDEISPLCFALEFGRLNVATFLIENGAKIIHKKNGDGYPTILNWISACKNKNARIEMLKWLKNNAGNPMYSAGQGDWFRENIDLMQAFHQADTLEDMFNIADALPVDNEDGWRLATEHLFWHGTGTKKYDEMTDKVSDIRKLISYIEKIKVKVAEDFYTMAGLHCTIYEYQLIKDNLDGKIEALSDYLTTMEGANHCSKFSTFWAEDCAFKYSDLAKLYVQKDDYLSAIRCLQKTIHFTKQLKDRGDDHYRALCITYYEMAEKQATLGLVEEVVESCEQVTKQHEMIKEKSSDDFRILASAYSDLGSCFILQNKKEKEVVDAFSKAIRILRDVMKNDTSEESRDDDCRRLSGYFLHFAKYMEVQLKFIEAVFYYEVAIAEVRKVKDKAIEDDIQLAECYKHGGLASLAITPVSARNAIQYFKLGLDVCADRRDEGLMSIKMFINAELGNIYLNHKYAEFSRTNALYAYDQVIKTYKCHPAPNKNDELSYFDSIQSLVTEYFGHGEFNKAIEYLTDANAAFPSIDLEDEISLKIRLFIHACFSTVHLFSHNYTMAFESFKEAMNALKSMKDLNRIADAKNFLSGAQKTQLGFEFSHTLWKQAFCILLKSVDLTVEGKREKKNEEDEESIISDFYLLYVDLHQSNDQIKTEVYSLLQSIMQFIIVSHQDSQCHSLLAHEVQDYFDNEQNRNAVLTLLDLKPSETKAVGAPSPLHDSVGDSQDVTSTKSFSTTPFWANKAVNKLVWLSKQPSDTFRLPQQDPPLPSPIRSRQ